MDTDHFTDLWENRECLNKSNYNMQYQLLDGYRLLLKFLYNDCLPQ